MAYGRRDNIVAEIHVTTDTTLVEARTLIDAITTLTSYNFVALSEKLVPAAEEDKRCVLWDCGRLVRLRPNTWISLDP